MSWDKEIEEMKIELENAKNEVSEVLENIDITSHFQISNLPGRCEPSQGEINYPHLFQLLESLDYNKWVGCEYRPSKDTAETLEWARAYGINNPTTS